MNKLRVGAIMVMSSLIVCGVLFPQNADAKRGGAFGPRGAIGGFHQTGRFGERQGIRAIKYGEGAFGARRASFDGPRGASFDRAAFNGYRRGEGALHASASQGSNARGGNYERAGMTGWKKGEGRFHKSGFNAESANGGTLEARRESQWQPGQGGQFDRSFDAARANGASASGYKKGAYDAATGTGTVNKGRDYDTASGKSYGYDASTTYTKGEGFTTTVDRQNKPDYTIEYEKGGKPIVKPMPAPAPTPAPMPEPSAAAAVSTSP